MQDIKTLDSRMVYQNKWMSVREDRILRPSGAEGIYGVVDKADFVIILPIQDDIIYLVEQYRYPVKGRYWELPQGSWESAPNADPAKLAAGELQEETGLIAGKMEHLGHQFVGYGFSSQGYHIYLATELTESSTNLDAEEEDLISKKFRITEFEDMILSGEIKDATTINAYSLAKLKKMI